jgi:transcriptional regulator with XRE-family HTH domain
MADDPWRQQVEAFGQFIHTQRKLAKLSLRELAALTDVSNAYLSQLERGLHAPSIRVLKSLAEAFNLSAETMLERAGLLDEEPSEGAAEPAVEAAIKADARLTEEQKEALLAVYRGFVGRSAGAGGPDGG